VQWLDATVGRETRRSEEAKHRPTANGCANAARGFYSSAQRIETTLSASAALLRVRLRGGREEEVSPRAPGQDSQAETTADDRDGPDRDLTSNGGKAMRRMIAFTLGAAIAVILAIPASAEQGTQSWLTPISGAGKGRVLLSPTAQDVDFYAQGQVEIEGAPANTTMSVNRAVFSDATCSIMTRPWAPVAPGSFGTNAAGAGQMHFVRDTTNPSGSTFYTVLQVSGGGTLLQTDCIAVYVK
jgi:hypothetical protein